MKSIYLGAQKFKPLASRAKTFKCTRVFAFFLPTMLFDAYDKICAKIVLTINWRGAIVKRETIFLKFAVVCMGIPVLALCIFLLPGISNYVAEITPGHSYTKYLFLIGMYATAVVFYVALFQTFKLLTYIDKNKAFSELSVTALKNIKSCAITISILYVVELPIIYLIADSDDAPGVMLIGLIITGAAMVIAVFAAVLQKLLKNAIDIKYENDLTV